METFDVEIVNAGLARCPLAERQVDQVCAGAL
jgi:hypothetical protein